MARITFAIDPLREPRVYDQEEKDPTYGGRRHVWVDLVDHSGSELTLKVGYGLATDTEVIDTLEPLMAALERMRDAARDRISDREWIAAAKAARDELPRDTPLGIEDDVAGEVVAS